MDRMTVAEARSYIEGQNRRHRQSWEQMRLLCCLIHKVQTGKELDIDLPWDNEGEDEAPEEREAHLEELRAMARMMEEQRKKKKDEEDTLAGAIPDDQRQGGTD